MQHIQYYGLRRGCSPPLLALCVAVIALLFNVAALGDGTLNTTANSEPIEPLPLEINLDRRKVELGERLFHDFGFAHNERMSCATCHPLSQGGMDRGIHAITIAGKILSLNTPTLFNSAYSFKLGWTGNHDSFAQHVDSIVEDRAMFASDWPHVIERLKHTPGYVVEFVNIYHDTMDADHIKDALFTFYRSLTTPNSRFDRYLRGDQNALTADEKAGYEEFKSHGCIACHQGMNVGGNMFQKFGIFGNQFAERGRLNEADLGRILISGRPRDRHVFRVPSLRNVAVTAPYFHDGSAATLEQAVQIMARYQLGQSPDTQDIELIVKFLRTLTGEYQGRPL